MKTYDYHWKYPKGLTAEERKEANIGDIWINGLVCLKCGDFIRSKNRHDFKFCSCKSVAIDGGSWYSRILGDQEDYIQVIEYYEDAENVEETGEGAETKE